MMDHISAIRNSVNSSDLWSMQWFEKSPEYRHWIASQRANLSFFSRGSTGKSMIISRLALKNPHHSIVIDMPFLEKDRSQTQEREEDEEISTDINAAMKKPKADDLRILQSLVYQLIALDPQKADILATVLKDKILQPKGSFDDVSYLRSALLQLLPEPQGSDCLYLFVDGINQTSRDISLPFINLILSAHFRNSRLRVLFSGCPIDYLCSVLADVPTISLETERQRML